MKSTIGKMWEKKLKNFSQELAILPTAFLPSMKPLGMALGVRISYLCRNSWNKILLGKPCLQIRIPSNTPLQRN